MYVCFEFGVNNLFASNTIPSNCSCDQVSPDNYAVATLTQTNNIGLSAELETEEDVIYIINFNSGENFTNIQECIDWAAQNNYLIFNLGEVLTNN